jgi:hypothetical protein
MAGFKTGGRYERVPIKLAADQQTVLRSGPSARVAGKLLITG